MHNVQTIYMPMSSQPIDSNLFVADLHYFYPVSEILTVSLLLSLVLNVVLTKHVTTDKFHGQPAICIILDTDHGSYVEHFALIMEMELWHIIPEKGQIQAM